MEELACGSENVSFWNHCGAQIHQMHDRVLEGGALVDGTKV